MEGVMDEVLQSIGWDSGFRLPIANEENQRLERELALLVIRKGKLSKELDDSKERTNSLSEHLKYVRSEVQQNQELLQNYRNQLQNEKHKYRLKEAERDNMKAEIRKYVKGSETINERLTCKRNQLSRNMAKIEKIKAEAEWDTKAMKAWDESLKKRDSDNATMKKFFDEDDKRLVQLETKRLHLQTALVDHNNMFARMHVDIQNYEQGLMRTGKMLAELKQERAALIEQWQESVKNLHQKDANIQRAHQNLEKIQETLRMKREEVEEQEGFLSHETSANKYLQAEIAELNVANGRLRLQLQKIIVDNAKMVSEQECQSKLIKGAAQDTIAKQVEIKQAQHIITRFHERMQQLKQDIAELEVHMADVLKQKENAKAALDITESMIEEANKASQLLVRRSQTLLTKQNQVNSQASRINETVNLQKIEVSALENGVTKIRKSSSAAHQELIRKKQLLSDLDMKVACLEAQIGNADAEMMQDYRELWEERIVELEKSLEEHTEIKNLLHVQILKLEKENSRLINTISADNSEQQVLKDKLQTFMLQIEGGIKLTKAGLVRMQKQQVAENVLKLKVDKLQKAMKRADKEIYDQQRFKIDLETTLKERYIEVNIAKDVLFGKKKNLEEDRGRLRADIAQKVIRIQQMQKKYELSMGLLGKDENGEPLSISTYKIKVAQERYELKQQGDNLDKQIRKIEEEIVAMENTLKLVNGTNNSFKKSLQFVEGNSADAAELQEIEDALVMQLAKNKELKDEFCAKSTKEKGLFREVDEITKRKASLQHEVDELEEELQNLNKENIERQKKIDRATKQIQNCKKKIDTAQLEKYDRELFIRQLSTINKTTINQLASYGYANLDVLPCIERHFTSLGLQAPKLRSTVCSSSADSIRSVSSVSSSRAQKVTMTSLELKFDDLAEHSASAGNKRGGKGKKCNKQ